MFCFVLFCFVLFPAVSPEGAPKPRERQLPGAAGRKYVPGAPQGRKQGVRLGGFRVGSNSIVFGRKRERGGAREREGGREREREV